MKTLFASIALAALSILISTGAIAGTFIGLNNPDTKQRWVCVGEAFNADGSAVSGLCQVTVPSSFRYAQPARYQYAASWDAATGAVTLGALVCYVRQHIGSITPSCPSLVSLLDTNVVIVLDDYPFWYVSTSINGAILLHTQTGSLIWFP